MGTCCELCDRAVEDLTLHHLVPRQKTKRKNQDPSPTITICSACHRQIHSLFNNTRLANELDSPEKLKAEPQMERFIAWVRKQKPEKKVRVGRKK
ncbi:MAG: HNH endonuclease [Leptolyngbyaceae cyanobacterium bins.59]|nr:HNH endonuclease [Leptolyngbyaceae cyanobacterium bins.59]